VHDSRKVQQDAHIDRRKQRISNRCLRRCPTGYALSLTISQHLVTVVFKYISFTFALYTITSPSSNHLSGIFNIWRGSHRACSSGKSLKPRGHRAWASPPCLSNSRVSDTILDRGHSAIISFVCYTHFLVLDSAADTPIEHLATTFIPTYH
jgi:hypothetical protein